MEIIQPTDSNIYIGETVEVGTTGSVLFVGPSSTLAQDNANFFWDDTNNKLQLSASGTNNALDIVTGSIRVDRNINFKSRGSFTEHIIQIESGNTSDQLSFLGMSGLSGVAFGGDVVFQSGDGGPSGGGGGSMQLNAGWGISGNSAGGSFSMSGGRGSGSGGGGFIQIACGGSISGTPGTIQLLTGVVGGGAPKQGLNLNTASGAIFNEDGIATMDLRVEGDTLANLFFVDASADMIGVNTNLPAARFHIISTTEQLRLGYNTTNYFSTTIDSSGNATLDLIGTNPIFTFSDPVVARIRPRVISMADATSFTPTGDTADINTQTNTQALGTLTANAPSGTPTDGQVLELIISSTNVQTFAWNAIYAGCTTTALPIATTGSSKTDKFWFQYNSSNSKYEIFNAQYGY